MRVAKKDELDASVERELRILSGPRRVEAGLSQCGRVALLAAQPLASGPPAQRTFSPN